MSGEEHFPTPVMSHLSERDFRDIYEPAEDSFLFMDALQRDASVIRGMSPDVCVEVGCGSGAVVTFLARMLRPRRVLTLATDVNGAAARAAQRTATSNGAQVCAVQCDLVTCITPRLRGQVDVLLFNPPYVPTDSGEIVAHGIAASWAGGLRGREVADRLHPAVPHLLSPPTPRRPRGGLFYQVAVADNDIADIERRMAGFGLHMTVVLERRAGREHLYVLRFQRAASAPHAT